MTTNKGKSDDNFKDKIKNLFRRNKESVTLSKGPCREVATILSQEILKDIGPESPSNNRLKTIKELADTVSKKKLEQNAIEALWCAIQDLFLPQTSSEKRHVALYFLRCLLEGQKDGLGLLRSHFFHVIQSLTHIENMEERLDLFAILSDNGKSLLDFEEEAGSFLLSIMPEVIQTGMVCHLLPLLISVVKFNAAYLDEDIVAGFVKQTCVVCNRKASDDHKHDQEIQLSLDVLAAVLSYSYLPSDVLKDVVSALCRMVNIRKYCEPSWELMRKLLGTHLGHSCIYTMCDMLQVEEKPEDDSLLRGAIFYTGMALWGSKKVKDLKHTPAAVLPSFLHALELDSPKIHYEVMLSTQRLVKKYGTDLPHATWEIILDLLETVLKHLSAAKDLSAHPQTPVEFHDTLTTIEQLYEQGQYSGQVDRFFRIIEMCASKRPEGSVILLITYIALGIHPAKENWIKNLYQLLDKYFRQDKRTKVRQKVLEVLSFIISINKHLYEDDLINSIVLPLLCHVDDDVNIRQISVEILMELAKSCSPNNFLNIINIVEKIMSCKQQIYLTSENSEIVVESSFRVVKSAVHLIVELFKDKLYSSPPGVCIKLYDILVNHLSTQIDSLEDFQGFTAGAARKSIVECLLSLRADAFMRVGIVDRTNDKPLKFSPFIVCDWGQGQTTPPASPVSSSQSSSQWCNNTHLYYNRSFALFIQLLEHEKDWEVLKCILENLPVLLQNKTIVLTREELLVDKLCSKLCAMINNRTLHLPEELTAVPDKFTKSNFHEYVFPVLASLVNYHNYLDRQKQKELIKCLEFGMVSKLAKLCVNALRLCTLEMQDTMMRLLPSVLLQLSKISATISMAIPVLAFLSSIVRLPNMYANFVEEEYMSVFAIALPYTNPFKFSHYTVSLSHHVIAIWFIRCRLPFRRGFVQFIHKGLKQNVLQQFEENARIALQNQNQDSTDRVRSGSYSEAALRSRRRMQSGSAIARSEVNAPVDEKLSQFHRELTETCTDVMARYTFGNFSPIPHRSHMAEFLLAGGQCQTWLVGNKLITVTTSGSGNKLGNSGVCEKCLAAYQSVEQRDHKTGRRRHKSAYVCRQSPSTKVPTQKHAQDDITLNPRKSVDDLDLDMSGTDVAVQTGSSLSESVGTFDNELLESLIFGMKTTDPQMPINICNCWCTNWAEVYIRAPSGNLSWMMRTENETGQNSLLDSQVQDITMIFASMGKKRPVTDRRSHRIESGSIGEEEYETLYKQHFENNLNPENASFTVPRTDLPKIAEVDSLLADRPGSLGFAVSSLPDRSYVDTHEVSDALLIPSSDGAKNHDITPGSIRRSNSSPSVLSGSSDTLSPRDSISDVVQFGPVPKRKSIPKSSDSDKSDVEIKVTISQQTEEENINVREQKEADNQKTVNFDTPSTSEIDGALVSKSVGTSKSPGKFVESLKSETDKNVAVPKEYTSMLTRQLSPSPASSEASSTPDEVGELPTTLRRPRGHTVAVTQPSGFMDSSSQVKSQGSKTKMSGDSKVGVSPSFVFLQLYHNGQLQVHDMPLLLPNNEVTERAIKMLDHIYPYETHKIGVIYVGPGQTKDEKAILSNTYGSDRYVMFIHSLGKLFRLKDCNPQRVYLGGLDTKGNDGEFTYGWQDESTQLIFHIATLMPNKESDPNCNTKKLHIGNDYVTVVYNDSEEDYKIGVIKGQFNYVNIVIKPLDHGSNAVTLQAKDVPFQDQITTDITGILGHTDTKVISDANLPALVRQIAIHCNLASMVLQRQASQPQDPFANNWLERLRKIKRMKTIVVQDTDSNKKTVDDFTQYV